MKTTLRPNRREFLKLTGFAAAVAATGAVFGKSRRSVPVKIYRLSLRGRRGCRSAKIVCANLRFASRRDAQLHASSMYDNPRVVENVVSKNEFYRLFVRRQARGVRFTPVVDLRTL